MITAQEEAEAQAAALGVYREKMQTAEAKSDTQRLIETLTAKAEALSQEIAPMQKSPSRYRAELSAKQKDLDELYGQLVELQAVPNPEQQQARVIGHSVTPEGKVYKFS